MLVINLKYWTMDAIKMKKKVRELETFARIKLLEQCGMLLTVG